ncbi:MAG: FN3 domain-containing metallophosphoesterase family protein [Prevotellaceae bacterium]|nr:FN3 domain-containing metallophosphoesterase family protein [Prevotellaceae bacterium]MDY3365474.1 FN3 domain-containing metallophosphoesterase family protein [Prevotella sp.]
MKKILLTLFVLLTLPSFAIKIKHGPYLADMDSTSATIVWVTDKPGMAWVEIAPDDDTHFYGKERPKYYQVLHGRKMVKDTVHQVRIEGLNPDTRYRYRIFTQELTNWKWSDYTEFGDVASSSVYKKVPYSFKTFPTQPRQLSFLVLNDIHERAAYIKELCKNIDFKQLDFVVLNGDMSNMIENQQHIFTAYIDTCVNMFATSIPMFMVRGNHETRGKFADYLYRYFPTPSQHYYQLKTIAGINFLILDSGEDKPDSDIEYGNIAAYDDYRIQQARWLKSLLPQLKSDGRPIISFCHIPPTEGNWHGPYHLQETFVPELNKMNISLMMSGHTHRHQLIEKHEKINFPNLINNNQAYLLCRVNDKNISIECCELNGKNKKSFTFPLKR